MGLISRESIDAVIEANDIVDVVSSYVRLDKKSSLNLFGLCPFHEEKTPSFSVSPGKQIFYCFGCQKGGNVIKFIQEIEHLAYPEAIRLLADRAGVTIEETRDSFWQERFERQNLSYEALKEAARHYYTNLEDKEGDKARAYLKQRGIDRSLYRKYGLGYSLPYGNSLHRWLEGKGIKDQAALDAGLIREGQTSGYYDFFRGRLMFPIMDTSGRVLAFGGRAITEGGPKYINSSETLVYHKGKQLFGIPQAVRSGTGEWFLVEGYMDVLALARAGLDNAVAPLGTALTVQQAQLIGRYVDTVNILMDGDQAGREATLRAGQTLTKAGLRAQYLFLDGVKDPDDYLNAFGCERLNDALRSTLDRTGYGLALLRHDLAAEQGITKAEYRDKALTLLAREPDSTKREIYGSSLARELGISWRAVGEEIERRRRLKSQEETAESRRPQGRPRASTAPAARKMRRRDSRDEMMLLVMLAEDNSLFDKKPGLGIIDPAGYALSEEVLDFLSSAELSSQLFDGDFSSPLMKEVARQAAGDASIGKLTLAALHSIVDSILASMEEGGGEKVDADRIHSLIQEQYQVLAASGLTAQAREKVFIKRLSQLRLNLWRQKAEALNKRAKERELSGDESAASDDYRRAAVLTTAADAFRMILQGE